MLFIIHFYNTLKYIIILYYGKYFKTMFIKLDKLVSVMRKVILSKLVSFHSMDKLMDKLTVRHIEYKTSNKSTNKY